MAQKITGYIKLQVPAGKANPSPPIGPALGSKGLNIMDFCKKFNAETQSFAPGTPLPVVITVYADKTFAFVIKTPPVSYLIKKAAKIEKGSTQTGKQDFVGAINMKDVKEIAKMKMVDMNANDVDAAASMVAGSARSMGVKVEGE